MVTIVFVQEMVCAVAVPATTVGASVALPTDTVDVDKQPLVASITTV